MHLLQSITFINWIESRKSFAMLTSKYFEPRKVSEERQKESESEKEEDV